jgi:hypothetical protein
VRRLIAFVVALVILGLQQPSENNKTNLASAEATTYGRPGHWEYTFKDWTSAQASLTTRQFQPAESKCYSVKDVQDDYGARKTYLNFTWKCTPTFVRYCYVHQGQSPTTCGQAYLRKEQVFSTYIPKRGRNPLQVFVHTPSPTRDEIWDLITQNPCEWSAGEQRLICPAHEGTAEYDPCPADISKPKNQTLAAGFLWYSDSHRGYQEIKIIHHWEQGAQVASASLRVRNDSPILEHLDTLHRKKVEVFLETAEAPSTHGENASQQGRLLLIEHGSTFGIEGVLVSTLQNRCADNLRAFHDKQARLIIVPNPNLDLPGNPAKKVGP